MRRYNPQEIEPKWQKIWAESNLYKVDMGRTADKFYIIPMLPYPSGDLHVGHWYNFAPTDTVARFRRMLGQNVLQTIGFDAFGLPAENAAIERGIQPAKWTHQNIATMTKQIGQIGASYDWSRTLSTCDPGYYHWNQWLFLQLYKHKLTYRAKAVVNWCPKDQTVLANEQVVGDENRCERCGTPVIQKEMEQWFFKITDYTKRLLTDLEKVDWPTRVKTMQINWIGGSRGVLIDFATEDKKHKIQVFTTRPDTLFGATYIVLAPEHPLAEKLATPEQKSQVVDYIKKASFKTELERKEGEKDKTGVFTGAYAINPGTKEKVPIWVADYVLMGYGTGAIMAVPAHDERDRQFAKKFDLPIKMVIAQDFGESLLDEQYVEGAVVIPYDPKTGLYLGLSGWTKGTGLVGGGRAKNETMEQCARRELAEETGITDIEALIPLGDPVYSHYFNDLKKINRKSFGQGYLAVAKAIPGVATKLEAHEKFHPEWQSMGKIREGIIRLGGGVNHWLEMCNRAKAAAVAYKHGQLYEAGAYVGEGVLVNSGQYDGLNSSEAREKIVTNLVKEGIAKEQTNYRLRDWLISRQRYWGTPIPIIYCDGCGTVPVPEEDLPVILPEDVEFELSGQSPLQSRKDFVNTKCPKCGKPAKRETDTMDTFVCSSWYFLRYLDNQNNKAPFDEDIINKWAPVDHYIGGIEHAILHLLYARFVTKFLHDNYGLAFDEPFKKLTNQGIILGLDGQKMSKSRGNVVSPDEQVKSYGADSLRLYLMFMGPYDQGGPYSMGGIAGTRRFLERVWTLVDEYTAAKTEPRADIDEVALIAATHRMIKKVTNDLEKLDFNTAIAAMMAGVNELYRLKGEPGVSKTPAWVFVINNLVQLLAPFAPHIAEEMWRDLGHEESVHISNWPHWDESLVKEETLTLAVQINGKVRTEIMVPADIDEKSAIEAARTDEKAAEYLKGRTIKKAIYVPGRLISLVVS
ncbi:MAG: class I tRNA ligase family protein [Candidatus Saccharimonadales bacterium]|jgi:leucyl-tRNA synthetase